MKIRASHWLLIASAAVVVGMTALRPSGTPLGRGESAVIWTATVIFFSTVLSQMWRSALKEHSGRRMFKLIGLSALTLVVGSTAAIIAIKLLGG